MKPVRHISMFDPTLPGVSLVSMYGLGVYTPALPDVCVVARSSSVLMQAILLFVFTSYCYVHTHGQESLCAIGERARAT